MDIRGGGGQARQRSADRTESRAKARLVAGANAEDNRSLTVKSEGHEGDHMELETGGG